MSAMVSGPKVLHLHEVAAGQRFTPSQLEVLAVMEDGAWWTAEQLASRRGARSKAAMTRLLRTLWSREVLEHEPSESHIPYAEGRFRRWLDPEHPAYATLAAGGGVRSRPPASEEPSHA